MGPNFSVNHPEQVQGWRDLSPLARELGEIVSARLASAMAEALVQVSERILSQDKPVSHDAMEDDVDAANLARSRRQFLAQTFSRHFERRYARACTRRHGPLSGHVIDFDISQLSIVDHDMLEDTLEPIRLAQAIQDTGWSTLPVLLRGFRDMLSAPEMKAADLPVGPKQIAESQADMLRDQPVRQAVKQRLMRALTTAMPPRVERLYQDLVTYLEALHPAAPASGSASYQDVEGEAASPPSAVTQVPESTAPDTGEVPPIAEASLAKARAAVARCLEGRELPEVVRDFLVGPWQTLIANLDGRIAIDGPTWNDAVFTMDDLAWSVTVPGNAAERVRQAQGLPGLFNRLDQGMRRLDMPLERRNRFFVQLAECHARALASSLKPVPAVPGREDRPRQEAADSAPPWRPEPPPEERLRQSSQVAEPGTAPAGTDETAALDPLPPISKEATAKPPGLAIQDLRVGAWLSFKCADGSLSELKLAWISPRRGLFLLTNRQGERALSLLADEITQALAEGRVEVLPQAEPGEGGARADGASPRRQSA